MTVSFNVFVIKLIVITNRMDVLLSIHTYKVNVHHLSNNCEYIASVHDFSINNIITIIHSLQPRKLWTKSHNMS